MLFLCCIPYSQFPRYVYKQNLHTIYIFLLSANAINLQGNEFVKKRQVIAMLYLIPESVTVVSADDRTKPVKTEIIIVFQPAKLFSRIDMRK